MVIYKAKDGRISVDIRLLDDSLWLSLAQITEVFERDKSVISRHLKNIFNTGELEQDSVVAKFATTASDGKMYNVEYYNLDAIISVGYRVNSKRGTEFRKWASQVLKEHLIKGYSLNQQQLDKKSVVELQRTIELLSKTLINQNLTNAVGAEILQIITDYTKTWDALRRFDEDELENKKLVAAVAEVLAYKEAVDIVSTLKNELISRKEASNQTFGGQVLYHSAQEKAAHLFYFVIKDHPFCDGNKRIGCLFFLMYLLQE